MESELHQSLNRGMVFLLATGCGVAVANNYYHQPLLTAIAGELEASESSVSYLPALNQAGFALGLLLLVPLGDLFERRRLILLSLVAAAILLIAVAVAPSFGLLAVTGWSGACLVGIALPGLALVGYRRSGTRRHDAL